MLSKAKKAILFGATLFLLLMAGALPGYGQISHEAAEKHERKLRKSLKEAAAVDAAAFKDTHLNTDAYTYKKGVAGRKRLRNEEREQYQFNASGEPVRKKGLFKKKKKYRQRDRKKSSS